MNKNYLAIAVGIVYNYDMQTLARVCGEKI